MNAKTLIAAAAVALSVAGFSASQADADSDVHVGFGVQIGSPDFFFSGGTVGHHGYPVYPVYSDSYDSGISCSEGRWVVKSAGYKKVKTDECNGKRFTYIGKKHGDYFAVQVSRWSGNIVSVSPL